MINVKYLDNNKIQVSYNRSYGIKNLIKYLNIMTTKFLYGANLLSEHNGWVLSLNKLVDLKANFKDITYLNEYIAPPYINIGQNLKLPPYDYQKEAIFSSLEAKENLLVLPCGAGKTIIAIGTYLEALEKGIIKGQGLIVVKASLKIQWQKEIEKFSNFNSNVIQTYSDRCINFSSKIKRRKAKLKKLEATDPARKEIAKEIKLIEQEANLYFLEQFHNCDLLIANYETLVDEKVNEAIKNLKIEFIACDEIHYSKTHTTDRAKALYNFNDAIIKIGATATPITKDPRDVYGIYKFINPDLFGLISHFQRRYIRYSSFGRIGEFINIDELKEKIKPHIFVKTKAEVASQLPKLSVNQKFCDLTQEQFNKHKEIMEELDSLNQQDFEIRRKCKSEAEALTNEELMKIGAKILALQTFAQELANAPILLEMSDSALSKQYAIKNNTSPKLDLCLELIAQILESDNSNKEKICIFSKYESMQKVLTAAINKYNKDIEIAYVNGTLDANKRYEEVYDKFKNNDNCKILLCSEAGAEGEVYAFFKSPKLTGNSLESNLLTMHSNVA